MAGKKPSLYIGLLCQALVLATFAFVSYSIEGENTNSRRQKRKLQRESESSPERIKIAFLWVAALLFIAVAPVVFRFVHVVITDPAVPLIIKEGKARGRRFLSERFGNFELLHDDELEADDGKRNEPKHEHSE